MGRAFFLFLYLSFGFSCPGFAADGEWLYGRWQFYKIFYQDQEHPPFNPDLILTWEFLETGYELLGWEREGQVGFCHRLAKYTYSEPWLNNEVVWVSKDNAVDCSSDPDMQMGRKTVTKVTKKNGDLWLHMSINGEPFVYIFKRTRVLSSTLDR